MFLKTFEEFPPRQKPASFSVDQAIEKARQKQKLLDGSGVGVK
jgi:arylsulfatase